MDGGIPLRAEIMTEGISLCEFPHGPYGINSLISVAFTPNCSRHAGNKWAAIDFAAAKSEFATSGSVSTEL